jgi:predicted dehydrogenase
MTRRALLIGCGQRGRQWAATLNDHAHWRVAGLVDPDPEARGKLAADLGVRRELTVPDLGALDVSQPEWDAVIVATPPDLHVEPARWAVDHGKAVLVEKPFTTSLTDAVELVEKAEAADVPLMVGQNYRYLRMNQAARRVVDSGSLGRIGMVVAHYYHPPDEVPPTLRALRHSALWGIAVHHLDALMHMLGCKVTAVAARSETLRWDERPAGASLQLLAELDTGATVTYSASYESSGHQFFEAGQEFYQRIVGEDGTLHAFHRWLLLCRNGALPRPVRRGPRTGTEEAVLLGQLEGAVERHVPPECSGRDNLATVAVLEACVRSAEERRWVGLEEIHAG